MTDTTETPTWEIVQPRVAELLERPQSKIPQPEDGEAFVQGLSTRRLHPAREGAVMTAVDAPLSADVDMAPSDEPSARPRMVELTRTTPRYTVRPATAGRVKGICQERGCTFETASFTSAGFLSGIFAAHGLVLDDDPTDSIPVCPSTLRVTS